MPQTQHEPQAQKQAYDIRSFCEAYSISRSYVYLEFQSGRLKFFKAGRRTLISRESAERWQQLLEQSSPDGHTEEPPEPHRRENLDTQKRV